MANDGLTRRIHLGIKDSDKVWRQRMLCIFHREILLVVAHDGHQHFFRQGQVFRLEVARQHAGPLGEMGDLLDQGFIFAPACARQRACRRVQRLADALAADGNVGKDKCRLDRRQVRPRASDRNGGISV